MKRNYFYALILLSSLILLISCAPRYHFGVPDQAIGYPSQFDETEAAIAQAERSPGAKYCPEKIAKAKELGKKGVETYWACKTAEAMRILEEARKLAKEAEACQPPPAPPTPPTPPAPAAPAAPAAPPAPPAPPAPVPTPPPPAPKPAVAPVFETVYFDPNKTHINPQAAKALDRNGQILNSNPDIRVEIGGHTDAKGSPAANQKISEKRALSCKKYLLDKFNIPEKQMVIKGYGATKPVADNQTKEGRAKNRRVEFRILP
jgi:outer membrane protein OmpA-like peptidoglycan-associated protein